MIVKKDLTRCKETADDNKDKSSVTTLNNKALVSGNAAGRRCLDKSKVCSNKTMRVGAEIGNSLEFDFVVPPAQLVLAPTKQQTHFHYRCALLDN